IDQDRPMLARRLPQDRAARSKSMHARKTFFLLSTALLAECLVSLGPWPVGAQPAEPTPDAQEEGGPPALVGRIAQVQGTVSFRTADQQQWQPATVNYPVTGGDALWTEPQATAELQVASSALWMNGGTELDVTALDEHAVTATEPQGELYLRLQHLPDGQTYTIAT